jgi:hypothetical protein
MQGCAMSQGLKQSLLLLLWQLLQLQRMMTKMLTLTQMMQTTKMMKRTRRRVRVWQLMPWIQKKTKMTKRMELKTPWLRLVLLLRCYSTIQHGRQWKTPEGAWAAAAAESAPTDGIDGKEEDGATELDEAEGESWA